MNHKILGIVTARGGSKGIPGKNIKLLAGKPLIAYTIEAAKNSEIFDRIILSTDDAEIADTARPYGIEVPFMRPPELAKDDTPHLPVIQHALSWLKDNEKYVPDYVMVLQPTSPFRQASHIKEAIDLIIKTNADSVLGVSEISENFNPHRAMVIDENGGLQLFNGSPVRHRITPRQALPKTYWNNCSIYIVKTNFIFDEHEPNFFGGYVMPYIMEAKYSIDINEPEDWESAEAVFKDVSH